MIGEFIETLTSENTKAAYEKDLRVFLTWMAGEGLTLVELRPRHLMAYRAYLAGQFSASTVNRYLSAIRQYLKFLAATEVIEASVYHASTTISGVKAEKRLPRVLTFAQLEQVLDQPDLNTEEGLRDYAFIWLLGTTGVRLGEAIGLDVEHIDLARRRAVVFGKGAEERIVLFTEDAAAALLYYLCRRGNPISGPLFVNCRGGRVSERWMQKQLAVYGSAVGIDDLHPHLLRHTFATEFLNRTRDKHALQRLLGHKRSETTDIYTRLATGWVEEVYRSGMEPAASPVRVPTPERRPAV